MKTKRKALPLRYEDDGKTCIVQGPIANPRHVQDEKTFKVDSKRVNFALGTPVVCHGWNSLPHLNGKHGDLREDEETGCYKWTSQLRNLDIHDCYSSDAPHLDNRVTVAKPYNFTTLNIMCENLWIWYIENKAMIVSYLAML